MINTELIYISSQSSIKNAINEVSDTQLKSAELTKNFELGLENDLTKVMINR